MSSALQRRLAAEWTTVQRLAAANPTRLTDLAADDLAFRLTLRQTPALSLDGAAAPLLRDHAVRIVFPMFFPAAPLELYLQRPTLHPNIHPVNGFVCLWERHRVSHTVEHALHKLAAMLGWRLFNREAIHVMQPDALHLMEQNGSALSASLAAPPLFGLAHEGDPGVGRTGAATPGAAPRHRRRLS